MRSIWRSAPGSVRWMAPPHPTGRALRLGASLAAVGALGASCSSASSSPSGASIPAALSGSPSHALTVSLEAAIHQGRVVATSPWRQGHARGLYITASNPTGGDQIITEGRGASTIVLDGSALYLKANALGMTQQLQATDPLLVGRWISIATTDAPYATVAAGITIAAQLNETYPAMGRADVEKVVEVDGVHVLQIRGPVAGSIGANGTTTIDLSLTAPYLPIRSVTVTHGSGGTLVSTTRFSRWGKRQPTPQPTHAIAYSSTALDTTQVPVTV